MPKNAIYKIQFKLGGEWQDYSSQAVTFELGHSIIQYSRAEATGRMRRDENWRLVLVDGTQSA